ncbi:hypothetical protein OG352_22970 [Streptomyces sp. NBC_01485]|uniref:hypothetical protein n=1 Tax=Streptomyces sp. NBC_01485 TaxID=2903884 RepID=UPI002E357275|nr:hypothetical protein [Streptomyces sp. NBC_01485]
MFDLRTEAEMRLHSERTARELALKKQREDAVENENANEGQNGHVAVTAETAATTDV